MVRIRVEDGPAKGRVFELDGTVDSIVGRGSTSHLTISDPHLSSSHGLFRVDGGRLVYRDLHSRNGSCLRRGGETTVVDEAVGSEVVLNEGDELLLGDAASPTVLRVEREPAASHSTSPPGTARREATVVAIREIPGADRLGEAMGGDAEALDALFRLTRDIHTTLDRDSVLGRVAEAIFEVFPQATHVTVQTRPQGEGTAPSPFQAARSGPTPGDPLVSQTIANAVVERREAILFADARETFSTSESIAASRILSGIAVPLWNRRAVTGILQIDNRRLPGVFQPRDLDLVSLFGVQLAHVLDNSVAVEKLKAEERSLRDENVHLRRLAYPGRPFEEIVGTSPPMQDLFRLMEKVLDTDTTVLIEGETGTGKELVARALHNAGRRRGKPFVAQNCAAIPEGLLESTLFGHVRGAFTGAVDERKGLFEIADGGTLLLDEVGEMTPSMQAKLLRTLQDGEIVPVGGGVVRRVDVRIVAATNRDLTAEVRSGRFRHDLFYRISAFPIRLPPLRERREDIPLIVLHLLERYARRMGKPAAGFTPEAMSALVACRYPGNVRELENEIERAVALSGEETRIGVACLSDRVRGAAGGGERDGEGGTLKGWMARVEERFVRDTLERCGWSRQATARRLGISRVALFKKMNRFRIRPPGRAGDGD